MVLELAQLLARSPGVIFAIRGAFRCKSNRRTAHPTRRKQRAFTVRCMGATPPHRRRCAVQRMKDRAMFIGHSQA